MSKLNSQSQSAVEAAALGDQARFERAVNVLAETGWDSVQVDIAEEFLGAIEELVGSSPSVNDLVLVAQAAYPKTKGFLNASVYDIEFLLRGFYGAGLMLKQIPRNVALIIQLALLGVLPSIGGVDLTTPARDDV